MFTCTIECFISKREAWFMPQRSATRIIRRRFLPASLGVMSATLQPGVGTVQQAAIHDRAGEDNRVLIPCRVSTLQRVQQTLY